MKLQSEPDASQGRDSAGVQFPWINYNAGCSNVSVVIFLFCYLKKNKIDLKNQKVHIAKWKKQKYLRKEQKKNR